MSGVWRVTTILDLFRSSYFKTECRGTPPLRTPWDNFVLDTEVSSMQRSLGTLRYYNGTQNSVLITEVSSIQRSLNTLKGRWVE